MILRFVIGLSALVMTFAIYFVATTADVASSVDENLLEEEWQTTLCTPSDEQLGELLWLDPTERLSVEISEDEAFAWGLLSPETSVFVNYIIPSAPSKFVSVESNQCEMASWGDVAYNGHTQGQPAQQCTHPHLVQVKGQAQ